MKEMSLVCLFGVYCTVSHWTPWFRLLFFWFLWFRFYVQRFQLFLRLTFDFWAELFGWEKESLEWEFFAPSSITFPLPNTAEKCMYSRIFRSYHNFERRIFLPGLQLFVPQLHAISFKFQLHKRIINAFRSLARLNLTFFFSAPNKFFELHKKKLQKPINN